MEEKFSYKIGDKTYIQKPLVLGQVNQIAKILKTIDIPNGNITPLVLINCLGDRLPEAIAIILHDPDISLKDKNVEELANNIAFDIDIDLTLGVISDFFDCTPVFSILEKIGKVMEKITEKVETEKEKIG